MMCGGVGAVFFLVGCFAGRSLLYSAWRLRRQAAGYCVAIVEGGCVDSQGVYTILRQDPLFATGSGACA